MHFLFCGLQHRKFLDVVNDVLGELIFVLSTRPPCSPVTVKKKGSAMNDQFSVAKATSTCVRERVSTRLDAFFFFFLACSSKSIVHPLLATSYYQSLRSLELLEFPQDNGLLPMSLRNLMSFTLQVQPSTSSPRTANYTER